jgi:hypothetical protein
VTCASYGSTKASSDIDVTIDGHIYHIRQGLITYIMIMKFLKEIFGHVELFQNAKSQYDVKKVLHFFDINFYLSNFAIKHDESLPDNRLSSYHLSTAYSQGVNVPSQFSYAFNDIMRKNKEVNEDPDEQEDTYLNRINKINILLTHGHDDDSNKIVNNLSIISTFEDECYHTQGAFFHVVMMLQRKIQFIDISENVSTYVNMMYASAYENITLAFTHFDSLSKRTKYVTRYNDAVKRIAQHVSEERVGLVEVEPSKLRSTDKLHSIIRKSLQSLQKQKLM